jgi:hypothetical protein
MAGYRRSTADARNPAVEGRIAPTTTSRAPGDGPFVSSSIEAEARRLAGAGKVDWMLLLVGGSDLLHFRLRVAQSQLRMDLAPSFWSHVGVLGEEDGRLVLYEVALDPDQGFRDMPRSNGIERTTVGRYEDRARFPNVAVLRFPLPPPMPGAAGAARPDLREVITQHVAQERGILNLPSLNPLIGGTGLPAAVFAEAVFAAVGVELTPGLSTRSSCPEAIWQAALWWHHYYAARAPRDGAAAGASDQYRPSGAYLVTQPEAAYRQD